MAKIIGKNTGGDAPGHFKDFGGGAVTSGYLLCDGSIVSQTTYKALFAAIGTAFNTGGEGAGNFRLPDCRRRVHAGSGGTATGTLGNTVGSRGGEETHQLSLPEIPSHSHTVNDPGHFHTFQRGVGNTQSAFFGDSFHNADQATSTSTTGITLQAAGGSGFHNNMQPSLVVTKMIKF